MGKITSLQQQKKQRERLNIFIDGVFAFGIGAELAYNNKLKIGRELTEEEIKNLINSDQVQRLTEKAVRFLASRPKSEKEVRDHFLYKGKLKELSDEEKFQYAGSIEKAIERLKKLGYINDTEFAQWWVTQRETFRKTSKRLLQSELLHKGIGKEIVIQVLDSGIPEEVKARQLAEKKFKLLKKRPANETKVKLGQYLARSGFDWELIKKVVDTLLKKRVE